MADQHDHHGPRLPDTSELFTDRSWGAVAHDHAFWIFMITFVSVVAFAGSVLLWVL